MRRETLYDTIKDRRVADVTLDVLTQILTKGTTNHRLMGNGAMNLSAYAYYPEIHKDMTYEDFKENDPKAFENQLGLLRLCRKCGFTV